MKKTNGLSAKMNRVLQQFARMVANMSFWGMAFFGFLLRVFVRQPWGPLLALIVGCIWLISNMEAVKRLFNKVSFLLKGERA